MKPLESKIERSAVSRASMELGVESLKLVRRKGYPDRMFLIPGGRPLLIEFKRPGEGPDGFQQIVHKRLRHYGYDLEVHDTVEGALDAIKREVSRSAPSRGKQGKGNLEAPQVPDQSAAVPSRASKRGAVSRPRPR